ncbi:MAG: glycosyltransferase family 39 protein [Deltaproteobacteria bacterium]|nr:glycosyltransferase family 39 protein [Deltaproteobacteria bacterium]
MRDPWLLVVLALSASLGLYQLTWGLPNGDHSWAADALGPVTVLGIVRRSLAEWNSGWFYFKYPVGYPLMLFAVSAPYLAWLFVSGQLRQPKAVYPYGFSDPENALYAMALLGRCLSVICLVATVALTYDIGRRLFGRTAGRLAAWFVASAYPVLYYAHTTNLDAAYLCWLALALWAAVVAAEGERRWPYVALGIAAAMAVSTKEQAFAFLLPLPLVIAVRRYRAQPAALGGAQRWATALWNRGTRAGLTATMLALTIGSNVAWNPSGFVNRIRYLSGQQIPGVSARLAPVEFGLFKGADKEWQYLQQLYDAIESSLGLPLVLTSAAGVVYVALRYRSAAAALLLPAAAQYYLSLRTLDLITLRYTLPLSLIIALCAGALCADALASPARYLAGAVVAGLCVLGLARAIELDLLLRDDPRYYAEAWLRRNVAAASAVEVYQKPVYLPRLRGLNARTVALEERTLAGLSQRRPDFIVTSSAAKKGITHRWRTDWRQGLLEPGAGAPDFLRALESEQLPYRAVARFRQQPALLRVRITSLCPEITVFARSNP